MASTRYSLRSSSTSKRTLDQVKKILDSKSSDDSGFDGDTSKDISFDSISPSPPAKKKRANSSINDLKNSEIGVTPILMATNATDCVTRSSIKCSKVLTPLNSNAKHDSLIDGTSSKKKVRFYPIFEKNYRPPSVQSPASKRPTKVARRRLPFLFSDDQYALDLGQKDFDGNRCKVCNMLYTKGEITDEKHHASYHDTFVNGLKIVNWKVERTLKYFDDLSRIISIRPKDPKHMLRKIDDLFVIADLELGINCDLKSSMKKDSLYLLFITPHQRIAGFVAAESIDHASPLLVNENFPVVSEHKVNAKIGVSRIWVHPAYRRLGIATALLEVLRANFFHDHIEPREMVAFSDPTPNGKHFAQAYTNRDDILVFQYNINPLHTLAHDDTRDLLG